MAGVVGKVDSLASIRLAIDPPHRVSAEKAGQENYSASGKPGEKTLRGRLEVNWDGGMRGANNCRQENYLVMQALGGRASKTLS